MSICNLTKEQLSWITLYQFQTDFDCIYWDMLESGELSFEQFARMNIGWYESHSDDVLLNISKYPQSDKDILGESK